MVRGAEGRPQKKAKARIVELLDLHFKAMGRVVYVAEDVMVRLRHQHLPNRLEADVIMIHAVWGATREGVPDL